ncbi:MAG: tetratricopeptide repeat protein [Alphaproteobacteria bacterium]|nr:tetratricopeptide repeat protein [Alphaproteobacteria bacterium]
MAKAADNVNQSKYAGQSLGSLEKAYARNSADPDLATQYAMALREADYAGRAATVLEPFANDSKSPASAKREYAAIQLALGNDEEAEKYAQKAVLQDPADGKAYHYLGIALDAQGKHPEAERAFRKGLDLWQGDPVAIMNNLALNLSAQGYLDEAAEILEKAKAIAPDRIEVERNLRIVTALRQSENPTTPKPKKRPDSSSIVVKETPPEKVQPALGKEEDKKPVAKPAEKPVEKAPEAPAEKPKKQSAPND